MESKKSSKDLISGVTDASFTILSGITTIILLLKSAVAFGSEFVKSNLIVCYGEYWMNGKLELKTVFVISPDLNLSDETVLELLKMRLSKVYPSVSISLKSSILIGSVSLTA